MRLSQRLVARKGYDMPAFWETGSPAIWRSLVSPGSEKIGNNFEEYVRRGYQSNGVVFACQLARQMLFSEARFAWRRYANGRPQMLFTTPEMDLLNEPWPGGSIGDLLMRMEQDAGNAGNFYATLADDAGNLGRSATGPGRRIVRLRPDWVKILIGSSSGNPNAADAKTVGYVYSSPAAAGADPTKSILAANEVVHYSPIPDPLARYRGMSYLTPVLRDIEADDAATRHKGKFFEQGATLSTVVTLDKDVTPAQYEEFVAKFKAQTAGVDQAYKTLFLGGGADVTINSANMQQLDFKVTQGGGETRIAAATGMHPTLVGLSEGLQGSSLNAGNFQAAIRLTADKTIRPLWRTAATALGTILTSPAPDVRLSYDDRDVAFLRDDSTDVAAIAQQHAATLASLTTAGYDPDSAVEYLETGNLRALKHTGLYSVQLQTPGTPVPDLTPPAEG